MRQRGIIFAILLLGGGGLVWLASRDSAAPQAPQAPDDDPESATPAAPNPGNRKALKKLIHQPTTAKPARIAGTVVDDASNQPIANLKLVFRSGSRRQDVETDASGSYQIELAPGRYTIIADNASYLLTRTSAALSVTPDTVNTSTNLRAISAATIRGSVTTAEGKPIAGALISTRANKPQTDPAATKTKDDGAFSIKVRAGEIRLYATSKAGHASSSVIYAQPGDDLQGIHIVIGGVYSLSGKVVGPAKELISAAHVFVSDGIATRKVPCNNLGQFTIGGLAAGPLTIQAHAASFSPSRPTRMQIGPRKQGSATGEHFVVLTLSRPWSIAGRVLDGKNRPVAQATVSLRRTPRSAKQLAPTESRRTNRDGSFQLNRVPDVPVSVVVEARGFPRLERHGVRPGTKNLLLRLRQGGGISGNVSDGVSGAAVKVFQVAIRGPERRSQRIVSADGRYRINDLKPGKYAVSISAIGYAVTDIHNVAVQPSSFASANAVLNAGGTIKGIVVDKNGTGIVGARVTMETNWIGKPTITDRNGEFVLRDVARGRRSLTVQHKDYNTKIESAVSIFAGKEAAVRVVLTLKKGRRALQLSGIGAGVRITKDKVVIAGVFNGPAKAAGLRTGDQITMIDGQSTQGWTLRKVIEAIRGVVGTPVQLRLTRGANQVLNVAVIRAQVSVPQ